MATFLSKNSSFQWNCSNQCFGLQGRSTSTQIFCLEFNFWWILACNLAAFTNSKPSWECRHLRKQSPQKRHDIQSNEQEFRVQIRQTGFFDVFCSSASAASFPPHFSVCFFVGPHVYFRYAEKTQSDWMDYFNNYLSMLLKFSMENYTTLAEQVSIFMLTRFKMVE